jgi:hypothetical protein
MTDECPRQIRAYGPAAALGRVGARVAAWKQIARKDGHPGSVHRSYG